MKRLIAFLLTRNALSNGKKRNSCTGDKNISGIFQKEKNGIPFIAIRYYVREFPYSSSEPAIKNNITCFTQSQQHT
jgi:hypothetical protein